MTETIQDPRTDVFIVPETPTVQAAWSAVMGEVTHLGKDSRNQSQGFNFRGIDAVMNLVGPVLRRHGVTVLPYAKECDRRTYTSTKGTTMQETIVKVDYLITGPAGDVMEGCSYGEASDAGDKSLSKAMSVALRTFLLQSLCLPTDEPDPDEFVTDRGTADTKEAEVAKTREGLLTATDIEVVKRVLAWAHGKGLLDEPTTDAEGNGIPLHRLFEDTLARLGDTTADDAAEQVLKESLGAQKVEEPAAEPVAEGAKS